MLGINKVEIERNKINRGCIPIRPEIPSEDNRKISMLFGDSYSGPTERVCLESFRLTGNVVRFNN